MDIKSVSHKLGTVLKDANLRQISTEFTEILVDSKLEEGVLKDLPGTNILVGAFKAYTSIQDTIFVNKLSSFLKEIEDIPLEQREEMVSEIDSSLKHRIKIGETLLYIIDKCDDPEKAQINAILLKAVAQKKIEYDDFLRCSLVIRKCMVNDLKWFIKSNTRQYDMNHDAELFNWGLLEFSPLEIKIQEKRNAKSGYELTNTTLKLKLSTSGEIIRMNLKEYIEEQLKDLRLTEKKFDELNEYINFVLNDFKKHTDHEKLRANLLDLICEICNNFILSNEEAKTLFSTIMGIIGNSTIKYVSGVVALKNKEVIQAGNDFNILRWTEFTKEFVDDGNLSNYRSRTL